MIKYFTFRMKDSLKLIILLSVIALISSYAYSFDGYIRYYFAYNDEIPLPQNTPIDCMLVIAMGLSFIVPIFEFKYRMRKITVDQLYSFPIKREKLFLTNFLVGYLEIMIPVTVSFLFFVIDMGIEPDVFDNKYIVPFYFTTFITVFICYSFVTFCFMRGNTVIDGFINIIFGFFFFVCLFVMIEETNYRHYISSTKYDSFIVPSYSYSFMPAGIFGDYFTDQMIWKAYNDAGSNFRIVNPEIDTKEWIFIIFNFIVSIVAFVLSIVLVKKEKSEDSMQISNSWFSYKVMIPFYVFFISFMTGYTNTSIIVYLFILLGGYILYVIYRRTMKIKWYDYCILVSVVLVASLIGAAI